MHSIELFDFVLYYLKLYCGNIHICKCFVMNSMINHSWDLKQHTMQVNGHALFHLHGPSCEKLQT